MEMLLVDGYTEILGWQGVWEGRTLLAVVGMTVDGVGDCSVDVGMTVGRNAVV